MHDHTEKRVDIVLQVMQKTKRGNGLEFDKEFYKLMMDMKEKGVNLWYTEGEEAFYRRLTR